MSHICIFMCLSATPSSPFGRALLLPRTCPYGTASKLIPRPPHTVLRVPAE